MVNEDNNDDGGGDNADNDDDNGYDVVDVDDDGDADSCIYHIATCTAPLRSAFAIYRPYQKQTSSTMTFHPSLSSSILVDVYCFVFIY